MKFVLLAALVILPPLICFSLNVPHPDVLSIFITIIGLWLTEAVALPVAGLLVPVLATLYGTLPATKAFDSFGSDILFLFLGCFLMGRSMEKYGFDKRVAYFLLSRCMPGTSFISINVVIALTSFFLSMWISNTSAAAILSAVTLGILVCLEEQVKDAKTQKRMSVRLLLTCAFAASIGGLTTPVGSPPNLIALKFLSQKGITISFLEWIKFALPISICMLIMLLIVFEILFPLRSLNFPDIKKQFRKLLTDLGPMKTGEYQIAFLFLTAIIFWVVPGILHSIYPENTLITTLDSRFSMSVVGLSCGLAAFLLPIGGSGARKPNLEWAETEKLDWGTLMLFGGGLTLGVILESSGTASEVGNFLFQGDFQSPLLLGCVVVVSSILMSEFASNTAAASILIPLIMGATISRGVSPEITTNIVLATTFAASFGFMLPVSTPPNAIVYGTGKVPARDMRRAGIFFDITGAVLIIAFMLIFR